MEHARGGSDRECCSDLSLSRAWQNRSVQPPAGSLVFQISSPRREHESRLRDGAPVQVVSRDIRRVLTQRADHFNIVLDDVSITQLTFGREYTHAIEAKQVAQQEAERAKFIVSFIFSTQNT